FRLSDEDLDALHREGQQYYQRYLSLFQLERYEEVVRDTERNLRLFRFVCQHARRKRDQWRFDQYRLYVIMMNTRGRGMLTLRDDDVPATLHHIAEGIARIHAFLAEYGRAPRDVECFELDFLTRWAEDLQSRGPPPRTRASKLQTELE